MRWILVGLLVGCGAAAKPAAQPRPRVATATVGRAYVGGLGLVDPLLAADVLQKRCQAGDFLTCELKRSLIFCGNVR